MRIASGFFGLALARHCVTKKLNRCSYNYSPKKSGSSIFFKVKTRSTTVTSDKSPSTQTQTKKDDTTTDTSKSQHFTDEDLVTLTGAAKSTIRRIRNGQITKSKYMEQLKEYQPSGTVWIKRT